MVVHSQTTAPNGVLVQLLERGVSSFAVIFEDGNLVGIGHLTTDFACARVTYDKAVALAEKEQLIHPDWRRSKVTHIPINARNGD